MEKIKNVSLSLSESFQPSDIYLIPEYLQLQGLSTEDGTDRQTVLLFFWFVCAGEYWHNNTSFERSVLCKWLCAVQSGSIPVVCLQSDRTRLHLSAGHVTRWFLAALGKKSVAWEEWQHELQGNRWWQGRTGHQYSSQKHQPTGNSSSDSAGLSHNKRQSVGDTGYRPRAKMTSQGVPGALGTGVDDHCFLRIGQN